MRVRVCRCVVCRRMKIGRTGEEGEEEVESTAAKSGKIKQKEIGKGESKGDKQCMGKA